MDNEYYIENNMTERMQSMDFELDAVSSQSSSFSASPQRSDTRQSDSYSLASPGSHRRQSSRRLESLAHKRCKSQSSLSRGYSPLTSIPQSRSHHLLKRSRNLSQSSRSRSGPLRSHSSQSSLSRSQPRRKSQQRLDCSSVSRKRSPSTTILSSSTSISSRKAYHSTRVRSRKHYTRKRTSQSPRSSRPRSLRSSLPRSLRSSLPRSLRSSLPRSPRSSLPRSPRARPRSLRSSQPKSLRSSQPRSLRSSQPRSLRSSQPRSLRSSQPRSLRSSRPRSLRSSRPRSLRSSRPRSLRSSQSRSLCSSQPRSLRSSQPRSLPPHGKGRPSSGKQKSSSKSSDENTKPRNFGVKVQFKIYDPIFDDKAVKDQIFRLFHKFGLVTNVVIVNSFFEQYAVVYFSRLYEQLAAISKHGGMNICGVPLRVSPWTGNDVYEQPKPETAPPENPNAKLYHAIKSVASYCDPSIFSENNAALHPSSSRTLLISKLPKSIAPEKLDRICEKFENILDIEVEQTPGEDVCSALVEFSDIVSLVNAGRVLNRDFFGIDGVRVCFAEMKPTNCMWVDGLPSGLPSAMLMAHFTVYGVIAKMLHDHLLCRALILYKQREDALFAVKQTKLRQVQVFGSWLMLDFASDMSQLAFCQSMQESGQDVGNFLHE